jgi:hypothetical protein
MASETVARLRPAARELRCETELDDLALLVAAGGGAGIQRAAYGEGSMAGVLDAVVARGDGSAERLHATG